MTALMPTLVAALILVALAFAGIAVKVLVKKNGQFKRHCASVDPYTGERSGCVCGKHAGDPCQSNRARGGQPRYNPLEVNQELLREAGQEAKQGRHETDSRDVTGE